MLRHESKPRPCTCVGGLVKPVERACSWKCLGEVVVLVKAVVRRVRPGVECMLSSDQTFPS